VILTLCLEGVREDGLVLTSWRPKTALFLRSRKNIIVLS